MQAPPGLADPIFHLNSVSFSFCYMPTMVTVRMRRSRGRLGTAAETHRSAHTRIGALVVEGPIRS